MKLRSAGAVMACALLVAGCSGEPAQPSLNDDVSAPETHASAIQEAEAPPIAFHFQSGDLTLGDFDPMEVHPNVFNPCEEITPEEYAKIGYEVEPQTIVRYQGSMKSCSLYPLQEGDRTVLTVEGNLISLAELKLQVPVENINSVTPEDLIFYYHTPDDKVNTCRAAVSTARGHVIVSVGEVFREQETETSCQRAKSVIDGLLNL